MKKWGIIFLFLSGKTTPAVKQENSTKSSPLWSQSNMHDTRPDTKQSRYLVPLQIVTRKSFSQQSKYSIRLIRCQFGRKIRILQPGPEKYYSYEKKNTAVELDQEGISSRNLGTLDSSIETALTNDHCKMMSQNFIIL